MTERATGAEAALATRLSAEELEAKLAALRVAQERTVSSLESDLRRRLDDAARALDEERTRADAAAVAALDDKARATECLEAFLAEQSRAEATLEQLAATGAERSPGPVAPLHLGGHDGSPALGVRLEYLSSVDGQETSGEACDFSKRGTSLESSREQASECHVSPFKRLCTVKREWT